MATNTAAATRPGRSLHRELRNAPTPVKMRIDAKVTVSEYVGYPRNSVNRCMSVISKKMKPSPIAAKYNADLGFRGKPLQIDLTATNGSSRKIAASTTATTRSKRSTRSPRAISASPRRIGWLKLLMTSSYGVKCQKNGASSVTGRTS